jgi:hypothetical protein
VRSADIKPGHFYKVRLHQTEPDQYVRIERKVEPRYEGDTFVWEGTRFQLRGWFTIHVAARDIIEETHPDAKAMRIIEMMEAEGEAPVH